MATMRERFEAWQRWWRSQDGPTPDQLQQAEDERIRRAGQAFEDEVIRSCIRFGCHFPGDGDWPRTPGPGIELTNREPDSGRWFGWVRW
jgi:hypothetical protein